jgi:hypothetical protein
MATALDPAAAAPPEKPPARGDSAAPEQGSPDVAQRTCANCGAPLKDGQDWCLQCGASAPGSLTTGTPSWRSGALVLGATTLLALGAAAAAYAAWGKGSTRPAVHQAVVTVARAPAPLATTPATPITPKIPITPKTLGGAKAIKPVVPSTPVSPPKIPLTAVTPKSSSSSTSSSGTSTSSATAPKTTSTGASTSAEESQPSAITLDTNAAATYNPYGYPASNFGDPSLAIDGDPSTAWTAQVNPAVAPRMAEGLVIDLKSPQKLSSLTLLTSTPGMTVQVYGSNGNAAPASVTDSAWSKLSPSEEVRARQANIKLADSTKGFRFVTLWISTAPASSIGTPKAPGHVSVNEIELFPAS